jgi:hypothetical protein
MLPCSNLGQLGSSARAPHGAPEDGLATAPLFGHLWVFKKSFKRHFKKCMQKANGLMGLPLYLRGFISKQTKPSEQWLTSRTMW